MIMARIEVKVTITEQDVKDMLWLMFDRTEFENPDSASQKGLQRLRDYNMLDERIAFFHSGIAHCYFVAKDSDGEAQLDRYLEKMSRLDEETLKELDSSLLA